MSHPDNPEIDDYPTYNHVKVTPAASFVEKRTSSGEFVFTYRISIKNNHDVKVKLLERFWEIIDTNGRIIRVQGAGVVGNQPEIPPGGEFVYESFTVIKTDIGCMQGKYLMEYLGSGEKFYAPIPAFDLRLPSIQVH